MKIKPLYFSLILAISTINIAFASTTLLNSPDNLRVQFIPDDAYYYLTLARNFSKTGIWSFDSGVSITSGFHPLFAYILALVYKIFQPDVSAFVTFGILASIFFTFIFIILTTQWGMKNKTHFFLLFFALILSSDNFINNTVSVTEWSLTLAIASAYWLFFSIKTTPTNLKLYNLLTLFLLGLFGSIARSDFGLLPFSILVATIIIKADKEKRVFALSGFIGTIAGLGVVFLHNFWFTGEILQSSAQMKAYWSNFLIPNYNVLILAKNLVSLLSANGIILIVLLFVFIVAVYIKKNISVFFINKKEKAPLSIEGTKSFRDKPHIFISIVSTICFIGYTLFYLRNGAIQPWYTTNFILPILLFFFIVAEYIDQNFTEIFKVFLLIVFTAIILLNIMSRYPMSSQKAPWPHQSLMLTAGSQLQQNKFDYEIGSWNAGIIGYYEGGHVINIDGLVNNDIYPYAINNNLPIYLKEKNICYVLDFKVMLTSLGYQKRGGYNDIQFLAGLIPHTIYGNDPNWGELILYESKECLNQ